MTDLSTSLRKLHDRRKSRRIIITVVFHLFLVSFLTTFTALIGSTLDGLIISHYLGETTFGAFGLASPLINLIDMCGGFIASGTVVACGNLIGAGNGKDANRVFTSGFTLCLLVGGILAVLLFFFPQGIDFLLATKDAEIFKPMLHQYVRGMAPGIPALLLCMLMTSIVQMDGGRKRVLISSFVLCGVNLIGDLIVVTSTDLGLLGVGLTTTLSYFCSFAVLVTHFFGKSTIFRLGFSLSGLKKSLPNGFPAMVSRAATTLRNLCYNLFAVSSGGPAGMIAWSTVNSLSAFLSGFPKGFGHESLIGSGVFYGERDKDTLIPFIRYSFAIGAMIIIPVIILVFLLAPFLVGLYLSSSSESYTEAIFGLRWYALGLLPLTMNLILSNYYQSAGKKVISNVIFFMDGFGMLAVYCLFFLHFIGFSGLWYSFFVGKTTVFLGTLIYTWIRNRKLRISMSDLLLLPTDFDVSDENKFVATLLEPDSAVNISEEIVAFCKSRGIDDRRSFFVGLALEEMSQIIIDEGFGDGRRHSIDIKVFIQEGEISIRLRDDCKRFDTAKRTALMNPEDPSKNPGIRILSYISKETEYYSALNVNCLMMTI